MNNNVIDNNKFRVENQTQIDLDEIKLINMIASNSFFIYFFIGVAIFNHLYYLSFEINFFLFHHNYQRQNESVRQDSIE